MDNHLTMNIAAPVVNPPFENREGWGNLFVSDSKGWGTRQVVESIVTGWALESQV